MIVCSALPFDLYRPRESQTQRLTKLVDLLSAHTRYYHHVDDDNILTPAELDRLNGKIHFLANDHPLPLHHPGHTSFTNALDH
jgi:hypothetical protein